MFAFRRQSTWKAHKAHLRSGQFNTCCKLCRLTQYGNRCDWLKDDKFLRDLEGDSVDTEILDEELRSLQEDEPQTCRGKSVKFLESNPLQIVLCVLVLIDAGVVVAEILLDLHAIRGQYREANDQLHQVLDFIKETHADDLHGYNGHNVGHILELLHGFDYNSSADTTAGLDHGGSGSGGSSSERERRDLFSLSDVLSLHLSPRLHDAILQGVPESTHSIRQARQEQLLLLGQQQPRQQRQHSTNSQSGDNIGSTGIYTALKAGNMIKKVDLDHNNNYDENFRPTSSSSPPSSSTSASGSYLQTAMRLLKENIQLKAEIAKLYSGIRSGLLLEPLSGGGPITDDNNNNINNNNNNEDDALDKEDLMVYRDLGQVRRRRDTPVPVPVSGETGNRHVVHRHNHKVNGTRGAGGAGHHGGNTGENQFNSYASGAGESRETDFLYTGVVKESEFPPVDRNPENNHGDHHPKTVKTHTHRNVHHHGIRNDSGNITYYDNFDEEAAHKHTQAEKLKEIAHILHYCSIGILGIFVAQLFLKLFGMGIAEFFKKKMEIFDAVIILASFALDLVFLEGIGGAQGEEAAALLIVFLLWRILRVINGIMVTAKKRQEFRIKLQKRARRRGDKKVELLEEDRSLKEKEIAALRELCARRGADEDEIKACKPRRKSKSIMPRMDTSMGLTSVASLSLSLSMSMSGGAFNSIARSNPILNRRDSIQDILPQQRHPRRSSLMSSKPIEILQNHFRGGSHGDKSPRTSGSSLFSKRLSMEKVVEEKETENGGEELINKRNTVCDAIQEGTGEANLALLDYSHGDSAPTPPINGRKSPTVSFNVENELTDDGKVVPLAFDRSSLHGTPSPSRSEHSQSNNSSMANGPVRRASTSSRHSNKEHDDVTGDVIMHQGDIITHHNNQHQHIQQSDAADDVVVLVPTSTSTSTSAQPHDVPDVNTSPNRGEVRIHIEGSPHRDDVASHLNEVTMHLDDVNTRLDDVATHLTDVIPIQDDDELSTSSDSEGHETTRL